ncbi:MAG: acyl-CoA dehydrogenase family protein [Phycisphaerales bacterium]|nr:acyl-CoA dehydrogenase family protein [Phycisphaerales bacterium]
MDEAVSDDILGLQADMRALAEGSLSGSAVQRDRTGTFWAEGWAACSQAGVMGLPLKTSSGGREAGLLGTIAAMETLGRHTDDLGLLFAINAHLWAGAIPIEQFGTDAQRARWMPGLADGSVIAGHGATEPDSGSDIFSLSTSAVRDGEDWILDGTKSFVANGPVADLFVIYATVDPSMGELGVSAFIVERDTPGLVVGEPLDKTGLRTAPSGTLQLQGCRVPADALLGGEGKGSACFNCSMEWERGAILAMHLGRMQRQLDDVVAFTRTRKQFGQAIGSYQSVANRVVDMKVRLEAARPLVYRIGRLKDDGRNAMMEAAIAKLFVSEAAVQSSLDAVQVMGSRGYLREGIVERDLRDALGSRIYSGTNEMQRVMIARLLGLPSSLPSRRPGSADT